jgi:GGDEF domain-containing protein
MHKALNYFIHYLLGVPILVGILVACQGNPTSGEALTPINVKLKWVHDAQFGGFYATDLMVRFRENLKNRKDHSTGLAQLSASIGYVCIDSQTHLPLEELIAQADAAMYLSKSDYYGTSCGGQVCTSQIGR